MKVKYAGTWLAPGGRNSAQGVSFNGTQLVDVQQLFRSDAVRPVARGNKADTFSFSSRTLFADGLLAGRAVVRALRDLAGEGLLEVTFGNAEIEETYYVTAAFQGVERTLLGLSPAFRYTFVCGLFRQADTTSGETIYLPEEGLIVKKGKITLTEGSTSKTVTFAEAFESDPEVYPVVILPEGGDIITCALNGEATAAGFEVVFSAPVPAGVYKLSWMAFATA